jgi:hypothetical protein
MRTFWNVNVDDRSSSTFNYALRGGEGEEGGGGVLSVYACEDIKSYIDEPS